MGHTDLEFAGKLQVFIRKTTSLAGLGIRAQVSVKAVRGLQNRCPKVTVVSVYSRVECGNFFLIGQNRSSNQRSGMVLEVQFQNFGTHVPVHAR